MIALSIVGGCAALLLFLLLVLGRGRALPAGQASRLARIGRLWARVSASVVGAKLRRLFAGAERRRQIDEAQRRATAARVAETMGQMKGAFMKLGQMMSFVTDEVPKELRDALAALQAQAPAMDFPIVRDVAERELGKPLERAFARFDERPLAAASIGQVHRARLPSGEDVVVKIQYPGVAEAIAGDMANVAILYRMMGLFYPGMDPKPIVAELRTRIGEELDYAREAANQEGFLARYAGHPFFRFPRVFRSHSTARVLTTEYVSGASFADLVSGSAQQRARAAEILYRFVFGSIQRHSVFNGDPHPGNYRFAPDGTITFLDFGCVKYFPGPMLADWRALIRAHFRGDALAFRKQLIALDFIKPDMPHSAEQLYAYFEFFYEPFRHDREFTFTREYNAKSLKMVFAPEGDFKGLTKAMNMPPDFVFVNRIQWGVYSILSQLGASGNWHRIHREYVFDDPPSTELGHAEAEWRHQRPSAQRS